MVIKVGGNELDSPAFLDGFARAIAGMSERPVIVHGGGRATSLLMERFGIPPRFVEGMRVTDAQTLELAAMSLVGQASTQLVSALVQYGVPALGLSGVDAGLVRAERLVVPQVELGAVGTPVGVQGGRLDVLLEAGFLPCVAPLCISDNGELLNVNADLVAQAIAVALEASRLIFITNVHAISMGGREIAFATPEEIERAIALGEISGGMIPKSRAAAAAVFAGVPSVVITDLNGLATIADGKPAGTTILSP